MSNCTNDNELVPLTEAWWVYVGAACGCIVGAAMAAGLTMGLVSLADEDLHQLRLMEEDDCADVEAKRQLRKLKKYAARLIPLKKDHHLLLVTLLLVNAGVNEALPIFLDRVVPYPWMAVLLSVTMVLIFGEILPSAIFTGPNQLKIASSFSGVVCVFMWVLRPIAWPIARLLDLCLGHGGGGEGPGSGGRYERAKLKALLRHHRELGESMEAHRKTDVAVNFLGIAKDQLEIMQGALDLRTTTCGQACVPLDQVYMLSMEDVLDEGTLADILAQGYSRIPVYENSKHNVCGLLLVKKLIVINSTDKRTVRSLVTRKPKVVGLDTTLLDALNEFQDGKSHLAIVCNKPELVSAAIHDGKEIPVSTHMAGIITIEDVIEKIIKEDVSDECEPERMKRLNNPFTHYTERGAMFKMQRLSRIKSIAAAMKQSARDRIKVRNNKRAGEGYARLSTRTPENENDDDENGVEEGVYSVVAPSGEDIRRFSKGLKKLESKHNGNNGENEERKTEDTIKTPLLQ